MLPGEGRLAAERPAAEGSVRTPGWGLGDPLRAPAEGGAAAPCVRGAGAPCPRQPLQPSCRGGRGAAGHGGSLGRDPSRGCRGTARRDAGSRVGGLCLELRLSCSAINLFPLDFFVLVFIFPPSLLLLLLLFLPGWGTGPSLPHTGSTRAAVPGSCRALSAGAACLPPVSNIAAAPGAALNRARGRLRGSRSPRLAHTHASELAWMVGDFLLFLLPSLSLSFIVLTCV